MISARTAPSVNFFAPTTTEAGGVGSLPRAVVGWIEQSSTHVICMPTLTRRRDRGMRERGIAVSMLRG
jgi:hypothetical protein